MCEIFKHFAEIEKRLDETTTKKDIEDLRKDISFVQSMPARLDRRVELLEDDMRLVKTKVGIR